MAKRERRHWPTRRRGRRRLASNEEAFLHGPSTAGGVVEGGVSADEGVLSQIHLEQDEAITLPLRELRDEERPGPLLLPDREARA